MLSASLANQARHIENRLEQSTDLAKGSTGISFVFMGNRVGTRSAAGKSSSACL